MSNPGWRVHLGEMEEALRACTASEGHIVPHDPLDDDAFRSCFMEACEKANIKLRGRQMPLYHKFLSSCSPIIKISEGIGSRALDDEGAESLVWKISLAALEVSAFASGHNISDRFVGRTPTWGGVCWSR